MVPSLASIATAYITSLASIPSLRLLNQVTEFSIDGTLNDNSDEALPTEKAVKTYVDGAGVAGAAFSVYKDTPGQSISTTLEQVITFGEDYDTGSDFASNTFTAPKDGKYLFSVAMHVRPDSSSASYVKFYLYVNDVLTKPVAGGVTGASAATDYTISGSCVLDLSTNDTVKLYAIAASTAFTVQAGTTESIWSGVLLA